MSWLSKATGIHLGNVGAPIGALVGSVVPGVGTALGAGLGQALGGLGSGKSVGQAAAQGVGAYAGTKGVQSLLGGDGSITSRLRGLVSGAGSDGKGSLGALGDVLGSLGSTGGGGVQSFGDLAKYGLGAAQLYNQAALQKKSDDYATNAFKDAKSAYDAKAPLRAQGQAGLLNAGRGNPFAVQPLSLPGGR